jgi:site-specific DNA-methyltransferase (cytosine-N4-specific)
MLEELHAAGGVATPGEIYDRLAARFDLDHVARAAATKIGDVDVNTWERHVRWTRQTAVARGLIDREKRGVWGLTSKARTALQEIVRGVVITIFESDAGFVLWGNAEDCAGVIERESVDLLWTSPPYPLLRPRAYGNREERAWLDWMVRLSESWRGLLAPTGSMMLNLGPCWVPGEPQQSLYIERLLLRLEDDLGLHLLQRLDWYSPSKLPAPLEWVSVRRVRVTPAVEPVLWLSASPTRSKADNRRVLRPYSSSGLRAIANPKDHVRKRPSGFTFGPTSFIDNGGSIPHSLISASNSASSSAYHRAERAAGRTSHPATAPEAIVEFGVKLATEENDLVYDPFFGSGVTGCVAQRLGRRFIGNERSRTYIESARLRFEAAGFSTRAIAS